MSFVENPWLALLESNFYKGSIKKQTPLLIGVFVLLGLFYDVTAGLTDLQFRLIDSSRIQVFEKGILRQIHTISSV